MIRRSQYRCSFNADADGKGFDAALGICRDRAYELIKCGELCNVSFYRYKDMGFLHVEEIVDSEADAKLDAEALMEGLGAYLKPWPREDGDVFFAPMIKVYYQYEPEADIDAWEHERTTADKTRIGRIAFVYPEKLTSYIMYHTALIEEGLSPGDKYAYISMHENLLFSYYEEPRNNVNLRHSQEESEVLKKWLAVDPESHFDRVKGEGMNFLVIPCLFSIDRLDLIMY